MNRTPPGRPGIPPRWTSSAKSGVGTALSPTSRVWFTLSHGIVNEVYYPRIDQACIRDLGLIVTNGTDFFSEEKRDSEHKISYLDESAPAFRLTNTCRQGRYRIHKELFTDPRHDTLVQRVEFSALRGKTSDYQLYVLLAPHLGNQGGGNTAWIDEYEGSVMLFAQRGSQALALASSVPWLRSSAGFVGVSDGWQDLNTHKRLTWLYSRAEDGNTALTGEIDLNDTDTFILALGFGSTPTEAARQAHISLASNIDEILASYQSGWRGWQETQHIPENPASGVHELGRISSIVLRSHESKLFPGAIVASLSIPWGFSKGDNDLGGYHIVWPRDLVEAAGGLLAVGARQDARRVLSYLKSTQEQDGHWAQNMWLDGTPYWHGIQMDETAFPIMLVDLAHRHKALKEDEIAELWPMVRRAVSYLVCNGPVTQQDRWEEDPGYSPFTLAVEIAALLVAADLAETNGEPEAAAYLRYTADVWNANIEKWTYVSETDLAQKFNVDGYYVRIAPPDVGQATSPLEGFVPIKNRPFGQGEEQAIHIISPDALALVRFGLRSPSDERIINTIKVIDGLLKTETPSGPVWHRYNVDGYGEHEDGSPFDGTGLGRGWPLLVGERAHYELAAGNRQEATRLLGTMTAFARDSGLIPEQVWDAEDIPEKELFFGRPAGSAMPLVWAHAEFLKLRRSLEDGSVFDVPPQTVQRYQANQIGAPYAIWRFNQKSRSIVAGQQLRIELRSPAMVHWTTDDWGSSSDTETTDTGLGLYYADLSTQNLAPGEQVKFTPYWQGQDRWENSDFSVQVIVGN